MSRPPSFAECWQQSPPTSVIDIKCAALIVLRQIAITLQVGKLRVVPHTLPRILPVVTPALRITPGAYFSYRLLRRGVIIIMSYQRSSLSELLAAASGGPENCIQRTCHNNQSITKIIDWFVRKKCTFAFKLEIARFPLLS